MPGLYLCDFGRGSGSPAVVFVEVLSVGFLFMLEREVGAV